MDSGGARLTLAEIRKRKEQEANGASSQKKNGGTVIPTNYNGGASKVGVPKTQSYQNYQQQQSYSGYQGTNGGYQGGYQKQSYQTNFNSASPSPSPSPALTSNSSGNQIVDVLKRLDINSESKISKQVANLLLSKSISDSKTEILSILDTLKDSGDVTKDIQELDLAEIVKKICRPKNDNIVRESGLLLVTLLTNNLIAGNSPNEAVLPNFLSVCWDSFADKQDQVKREGQHALDAILLQFNQVSFVSSILPECLNYLANSSAKWQSKLACLKTIDYIRETCQPDYLEKTFKETIPVLCDVATDFKSELAKKGHETLLNFVKVLDNLDLQPRYELIVDTLTNPSNISNCVKSLASVTFVAEVTEPALALLVPILTKSLNGSSATVSQEQLRQTVIITENLTRLVNNRVEIESFIPALEPGIKKVIDNAANKEVRELAGKAMGVLTSEDEEIILDNGDKFNGRLIFEESKKLLIEHFGSDFEKLNSIIKQFLIAFVTTASNVNDYKAMRSYFANFKSEEETKAFVSKISSIFDSLRGSKNDDEDDGGIEIVNADFSLAYGSRMLLNKTKLRLIKGHRYGLCGRNGAGKSTLMRSINNGQLEGFPSPDQLKTCFVEHKIQESETNMDLVTFIAQDEELEGKTREDIAKALESVGFNEERRSQNVGSLSGGWKMKLELARAMLLEADVLLLDEPTNHLDVSNVKWLQDYLLENTEITSLIVSHDTGFLDTVCTDIIHYENKKLAYYKGNLFAFVEQKPEAKAYYTLTDSNATMHFPPAGILSGVKSNTRAVCKMTDICFTYPGAPKPSLMHASCALSLSSRVAVLGPNGAGKSTLIKLLTGELVPDSGKVEKHPNLRYGYIAQHALQHVNEHKEKTANQYLQWRYQFGEDREVLLKESRKFSKEEEELMSKKIDDGSGHGERLIEAIVGRQKYKKSFKYEIKWMFYKPKTNTWLTKEFLLEQGFNKLVQKFDDHEASREGLGYRELTPSVITKHFEDVGLDSEICNHTPLGSLSGGQLVKVVIAGAMWNNPHLLVLDEPTNYLDRDSLGALAVAIREWNGGVVMISHNSEFVGALCPEQWHVADGALVQKGIAAINSSSFEDGGNENAHGLVNAAAKSTQSSVEDADGEFLKGVKVRTKKKKMTRNDKKLQAERRRLRYIEWLSSPKGTPKPKDTDDEDEDEE
ncbi:[NU+] prion formation protein 1 [Hanseniaspora valbyensis]